MGMLSAIDGPNGWPLLHEADYSKGKFYVLTIPDNFADLYHFPAGDRIPSVKHCAAR